MPVIKKGIIDCGEYEGWGVLIDDDRDGETGGFYLLFEKSADEGFDCWFETEEQLSAQLSEYKVTWEL